MEITIPEQIFCFKNNAKDYQYGDKVLITSDEVIISDNKTLLRVKVKNNVTDTLVLNIKDLKRAKTRLKIKGDLTFNLLSIENHFAEIKINDKSFIIDEGISRIPDFKSLFKTPRVFEVTLNKEFLEIFKLYGNKDFICKNNIFSVKIGKDTILTQEVKAKDFFTCYKATDIPLDSKSPFIFSSTDENGAGILTQGNTEFYMMAVIK